ASGWFAGLMLLPRVGPCPYPAGDFFLPMAYEGHRWACIPVNVICFYLKIIVFDIANTLEYDRFWMFCSGIPWPIS
ncbi:hypothetical protein, partial [Craterilacuibacter sp.]|uniref:hypothetical protein n=1 Tax=Craterilacuibacter sp. TaxID=2870909 RepID=UPI003F3B8186